MASRDMKLMIPWDVKMVILPAIFKEKGEEFSLKIVVAPCVWGGEIVYRVRGYSLDKNQCIHKLNHILGDIVEKDYYIVRIPLCLN